MSEARTWILSEPSMTVRMQDNRFRMAMPFEFDAPAVEGGTW
jgi:hypothetical protein